MPAPIPSRAASAPALLPPVTVSATPAITSSASSTRVTVSASFRSTRARTATITGAVYSNAAVPAPPAPIARQAHPEDAAAGRRLERRHVGPLQALAPERRERAVGGSRDGVLVDTDARCEEARDEIEARHLRPARHDDAARLHPFQCGEVGLECAHARLRVELEQVVELAATAPARGHAERLSEPRGERAGGGSGGGEIELDPVAPPLAGEQAALGMETGRRPGGEVPVFPQDVPPGECGATAQRPLVHR